jgi:hypothetical protein
MSSCLAFRHPTLTLFFPSCQSISAQSSMDNMNVIGWGKLLFASLGLFVMYSRVSRSAVLKVSLDEPGNFHQSKQLGWCRGLTWVHALRSPLVPLSASSAARSAFWGAHWALGVLVAGGTEGGPACQVCALVFCYAAWFVPSNRCCMHVCLTCCSQPVVCIMC